MLTPQVHDWVNHHFDGFNYGQDLYFCSTEDALSSQKSHKSATVIRRKVMTDTEVYEGFQNLSSDPRLSVFIDTSCSRGLQLLRKAKQSMSINFRWLLYTENLEAVAEELVNSRLGVDSDVTIIRMRGDSTKTLQYIRLSRVDLKLPLSLMANYTLEDVVKNAELHSALAWRRDNIDLEGYTYITYALCSPGTENICQVKNWNLRHMKTVVPGVDYTTRHSTNVVSYLMDIYNFNVKVSNVSELGTKLPNGKFNGSIAAVSSGEIEFASLAIRSTVERAEFLRFSVPIAELKFNFILFQQKTFGTPTALIDPFSPRAWAAICALFFTLVVALRSTIISDNTQQLNDSLGGSLILVLGSIHQGPKDTTNKHSTRAVYITVILSLFLLFTYYNSAVLSGLIVPSPDPIQNIEDLLDAKIPLGGDEVFYIRREIMGRNDTVTLRVRKNLIPEKFLNIKDGVLRVRKEKFAFYGLSVPLLLAAEEVLTYDERCLLTEIQLGRQFPLSFYWRRDSPFPEIVNRGLLMMYERGILHYLKLYWYVQKPKCTSNTDFEPISVQGFAFALAVYSIGAMLSLLIIIAELIIKRSLKRVKIVHFRN
ncbi:Ligand-gated ion channel [Nesidiocoris tenuis]|uniref:Ligand-gated ion channel n=1 Tax=Nesidiocoris tenuis TaxID=355587 RepID=A0ABN7AJS5_9HEMI|nr:Ligand-gated ion channel [Nesidiocoris tenuis]